MGFFVDLHIHIGRTSRGEAVEVSASSELTLDKILWEAAHRKGLDAVGIVDCASPGVQEDVRRLVDAGELAPLSGGGLIYKERLAVHLASEIGVDVNGKEAHFLSYL